MMKMMRFCLIAVAIVFLPANAFAETSETSPESIPLTFPLIDAPYNFSHGYRLPGMTQSLYLSKAAGQYSADTIGNYLYDRTGPVVTYLSIGLWDYLYTFLPLGTVWIHEEYHRAVLGNRGFDSYNEINDLNVFKNPIYVNHVTDAHLAELKEKHPAEFVRLAEAGNEGQFDLVRESRRDYFFSGRNPRFQIMGWWASFINASYYIWMCARPEIDRTIDESNESDGSDMRKRDFAGPDFTTWVYDLFRPDEPYAARGIHPSGVGVDRYIKYSDLTSEEKKYLNMQWKLSMLNFASPQLFGINRFTVTDPFTDSELYINGALMYYMTSFGNTVDLNMMFREGPVNLAVTCHTYSNHEKMFPGFEVQIYRYPAEVFTLPLYISLKGMAWLQPRDQMFFERESTPGGLLGAGAAIPVFESLDVFVYGEIKSQGWVSGNVELESGRSITAGVDILW